MGLGQGILPRRGINCVICYREGTLRVTVTPQTLTMTSKSGVSINMWVVRTLPQDLVNWLGKQDCKVLLLASRSSMVSGKHHVVLKFIYLAAKIIACALHSKEEILSQLTNFNDMA